MRLQSGGLGIVPPKDYYELMLRIVKLINLVMGVAVGALLLSAGL